LMFWVMLPTSLRLNKLWNSVETGVPLSR
jgi:hypothetical protein